MKILPLFGLRKNSFLTLLFYRFLPLIGRFFCFSFLFVTAGGGSTVYGWVDAADVQAAGGTEPQKMRVGARVQYSGPVYRDSAGNGQGKTVSGTYTVKYYCPGRTCGVHIDGLGWVAESACKVIG